MIFPTGAMNAFVPVMDPAPGEHFVRYVGDRLRFVLRDAAGRVIPDGWEGRLRTTIGRAQLLREEIILAHSTGIPPGGRAWRDIPMRRFPDRWELELTLGEPGYFKAKAYAVDPRGWQHWPPGPDVGVSVHPNQYRTWNVIYCAFPRLFGPAKHAMFAKPDPMEDQLADLERQGYTVIPPSGKLRELKAHLPHIIDRLGCHILHLLPIMPTPTTYAKLGRCGSPYASLDLTGIDPALVEFDRRTTGVDQFQELAYEVHARGGRLFLDVAINHTGWGSVLQERHPEWFQRAPDGTFVSPGAWGVTWEDLVELRHDNVQLWDELVEVFLTWCRRGVDGFRCDAGYKVPVAAWQYIIASVQQEFPDTIFLLEGLGGAWEATEALLTEGGMQWAYSELFQNYTGAQVAWYLDYALRQSRRLGTYVHYAETHDNNRMAVLGRHWSLLRTRLCALASVSGAFGFTCGVEWLAKEKIDVHQITGLAWDNPDNIVPELAALNRLLAEHPCFFDGAEITRVSPPDSPVLALKRVSACGLDAVLVLVNTDPAAAHALTLETAALGPIDELKVDLLGQAVPEVTRAENTVTVVLGPGAAYCLAGSAQPRGLAGERYRRLRAVAAWAYSLAAERLGAENVEIPDWVALAELVDPAPDAFLAALQCVAGRVTLEQLAEAMARFRNLERFPALTVWRLPDRTRVTPVPLGHWLMIRDDHGFRAELKLADGQAPKHGESVRTAAGHIACFASPAKPMEAELVLERYAETDRHIQARVLFTDEAITVPLAYTEPEPDALVLLTNGRGGMARLRIDLGRVMSKYDCVLGCNLHPQVPVDRHIFVGRMRVWVNADGFLSQLNLSNLLSFKPGPPAVWHFAANAGDARTAEVELTVDMLPDRNTTVLKFRRLDRPDGSPGRLPPGADVRLTVRFDVEDRNFHHESHRSPELENLFQTSISVLPDRPGFVFKPGADRQLRAFSNLGIYHPQPEWSHGVFYPVEAARGLTSNADLFSPGWFELPLLPDQEVLLVLSADESDPNWTQVRAQLSPPAGIEPHMHPVDRLRFALAAYLVRRSGLKTVIAGYPWFLDWGRDALICVRGLIAAGEYDTAREILLAFAMHEDRGTLPNAFSGESVMNRDTVDAPLWFGLACEELVTATGPEFLRQAVPGRDRTVIDVLMSVARHYLAGTPNGIRVDPASGLVWAPAHFTWMDTNHPACTPREGYPIEIQALWIRLLEFLARVAPMFGLDQQEWLAPARRARAALEELFWLDDKGWYADVLLAGPGQPAASAVRDDALRPNFLLAIALGILCGPRARRAVEAARNWLLVPGAVRSLAPMRVQTPLIIRGPDGQVLGDPQFPYRGRYEGPEDTSRKPAYHNGTAWCWLLPVFCEALAEAWPHDPTALHTARAYLGSVELLIQKGCLGHLPEICDGDAPHTQRGCDAQAWSVAETLRVLVKLRTPAR